MIPVGVSLANEAALASQCEDGAFLHGLFDCSLPLFGPTAHPAHLISPALYGSSAFCKLPSPACEWHQNSHASFDHGDFAPSRASSTRLRMRVCLTAQQSSSQNAPKMVPKWFQKVLKWSQKGPKMIPKMVPKWQNGPKMVPNSMNTRGLKAARPSCRPGLRNLAKGMDL